MTVENALDIDLLRTFVAVADSHGFAAAGARLGLTQSAVSQKMQRLESQLGLSLFAREGRRKQLTTQGRQLLGYARQLLSLNDETLRALRDDGSSGLLRIGSPPDVDDTILPAVLGHITRSAPNLRVEIHVGRSPHLMAALNRGDLDLAISTRTDPALEGIPLRTSQTVWLCSSQFRYDRRAPVPLVLADEPSIFRRLALQALDEHQVKWHQTYLAPSLVGIKAAVRAGLGITARTTEVLAPDMRTLGEHEGLPRLPDVTYFLWIRRRSINEAAKTAFEMLKGVLERQAI